MDSSTNLVLAGRRREDFSLAGLDHLALLVRNEVGVKARRWVITLRSNLRRGDLALVDPVKLMARIEALEGDREKLRARLDDAKAQHVRALELGLDNVRSITKDAFSAIASALARRGALKKAEKKLLGEIENGQRFLLPPADENRVGPLAGGN